MVPVNTTENASSENEDSKKMKYIAAICRECHIAGIRPTKNYDNQFSRLTRLQYICRDKWCMINQKTKLPPRLYSYTTLANQWGFKNYVRNDGKIIYDSRSECKSVVSLFNRLGHNPNNQNWGELVVQGGLL